MIENENDVQAPETAPELEVPVEVIPPALAPEAPAEDVQDSQEAPVEAPAAGTEDTSMGATASDAGASPVETVYVAVVEDRPFMTISFQDYSVTEGLLLLVFVLLFVQFFLGLVRRWFKWLRFC